MGYRAESKWQHTSDDGTVESSGWSKTTPTEDGGTFSQDVFHSHGADGEVNGSIEETETKDASGKTTEGTRTVWNADESGETTVTHPDGSKTVTTFDKDGKVTSEQHFNAEGNEVEPEKNEFWDVDIIYGDHSEPFADMGGKDGFVDMTTDVSVMMEQYVDQFDFIM